MFGHHPKDIGVTTPIARIHPGLRVSILYAIDAMTKAPGIASFESIFANTL